MPHRVLALAALVLLVTLGLCLAHDDDASSDLCGSALPATGVLLASAPVLVSGYCLLAPVSAYRFSPADRPAPPPRA
jgi:hypothetical protein